MKKDRSGINPASKRLIRAIMGCNHRTSIQREPGLPGQTAFT